MLHFSSLSLPSPLQVQTPTVKLNGVAEKPRVGDSLTAMGFGRTREEGSRSYVLRDVQVTNIDPVDCRQMLNNQFQSDVMICAMDEGADS